MYLSTLDVREVCDVYGVYITSNYIYVVRQIYEHKDEQREDAEST